MKAKIHFNPISQLQKHIKINSNFSNPIKIIRTSSIQDIKKCIDEIWQYSLAGKWCLGFISFEAAQAFDKSYKTHISKMPLIYFAIYDTCQNIEFDNNINNSVAKFKFSINLNQNKYKNDFAYIKSCINNGDIYQINYTQNLQNPALDLDYNKIYYSLLKQQPNAYSAYIQYTLDNIEHRILSFSPELFFHYTPINKSILTQPMKGTSKRGQTQQQDDMFKYNLSYSAKEQAENIMIVDLLRNDLSKICEKRSIKVENIFECIKLPTVWQMISSVKGVVKDNITLFEILRAIFPCGSITGAPKIESMKIINKLEDEPRNIYCGTIGLIKPYGECIFNVAIRTLYTTYQDDKLLMNYGVGSGITIDANCEDEFLELYAKTVFLNN